MAFSTQKDFFHVPFMNESPELGCKKACVKLKSYESTIDDRSWASDEAKQSKFLSDLVTCQYPTAVGFGEGDFSSSDIHVGRDESHDYVSAGRGPSSSTRPRNQGDVSAGGTKDNILPQLGNLTGGDSLLECANVHLAEYQKILNIKTTLEKQLEVSNERLKTAKEENKKIREILTTKLDSNTAKDFFNKIQKLTTAGKLNKNEENEMLQIYQKMENLNKSYEILQAENNYLKRLIEKLTGRVTLDSIQTQPEKSNDISYLQKEINTLRKECIMLRKMEDEYQRLKQQQQTNRMPSISEQDAENIKAIIKERNSLREKCKSFKALEQQVQELQQKAAEANEKAGILSSNLNNQTHYIGKMEGEMQNMQKYYEDQNQNACFKEECLKAELEDLKNELVKAKCQAQKADMLAMEVSSLRNEVLKRDLALNDYDCQYKQLMDVVNELQSVKLQCLHDNQTQTGKNQTDELAFYTCATLDEILKELKKRGCLNDETMIAYGLEPAPNDSTFEYDKQCCREMRRLQQQVDELKKEMEEGNQCETMCADALKRLKELETENNKLLQEKQYLNEKLKDGEDKMVNMLNKIEHLDKEINKNGQEANRIGRDLQGTMGLVRDISDVQLRNQQLANAVSAINSRDDQKIIDDLRRQLEEELAKLKKCQIDNARLQEEAKVREMDLKELKDLNNKLEADKKKLEKEYNQLQNDKDNLKNNLNKPEGKAKKGRSFEKELRKILEEFIHECGYCFCRLFNTKSKLYVICHKLYHSGIDTLSFRELAYLHKKIYAQAEQLLPGCLLDMILSDHREKVESMLNISMAEPRLVGGREGDLKMSESNVMFKEQKCCCCKNELCCSNSEEMLKDKVNKLEKDIEIARDYLETLKNIPLETSLPTDNGDSTDTNNSTYRASSTVMIQQKSRNSRHIKKLKSRLIKHPDI
ncbi:myosin-4-like [Lucilia sericata]|uniref:myosin-4-like n=1 Tax=Lucilia sericata TaxID=13632 RepID=UPI0018A7F68E|nr:myosin-4-like [Lucilia sericata]